MQDRKSFVLTVLCLIVLATSNKWAGTQAKRSNFGYSYENWNDFKGDPFDEPEPKPYQQDESDTISNDDLLEKIKLLERQLESRASDKNKDEEAVEKRATCSPACTNKGECRNGTCICPTGFTGIDCSKVACVPDCQNNGVCVNGVCSCTIYYEGKSCETPKCQTPCANSGTCTNPYKNTCNCTQGWAGQTCTKSICKEPLYCKHGGTCHDWDKCTCPIAYRSAASPQCQTSNCEPDCGIGGTCTLNVTTFAYSCKCKTGYTGADCKKENKCAMPKDTGICKLYLDEVLTLSKSNALSWSEEPVAKKYCLDYLQLVSNNIQTTDGRFSYTQCLGYCDTSKTAKVCDRIWKPETLHLNCEGHQRFYYAGGKCQAMAYKGGLGNKNNFKDVSSCTQSCTYTKPTISSTVVPVLAPFNNTCYVWGRQHYATFDGKMYDYYGTCSYILIHDKEPTSTFQVVVVNDKNCNYNATCNRKLKITADSKKIYLGQKTSIGGEDVYAVKVDDKIVDLPYTGVPRIKVAGRYVMVITQENAIIYWDGVEDVMIKVPDSFKSSSESNHRLFGLCGTFDGNKDNDFVGIDGVAVAKTNDFAKKWVSETSCAETSLAVPPYYSPTGSNEKAILKAEELCSVIQTAPFSPCFPHILTAGYKKLCMKDVLLCNYDLRRDCVCNALSLYSRACQLQKNITLSWRSAALCPAKCSGNMVYKECGSACPKTCSNLLSINTEKTCVSKCVDGCNCADNLWRDNNKCVPQSECSCYVDNVRYPHGTTKKTACEDCMCTGGLWSCKRKPCSATCSVVGDPHVRTFDGKTYSMYGKCAYTLAEHCHYDNATGKQWELIVKNSDCTDNVGGFASCTRSLILKLLKTNTVFSLSSSQGSNGQRLPNVQVDGREENWAKTDKYTVERVGKENVVITASLGLRILWTGRNVYFTVGPNYENKTCGLCGTFNFNIQDDFHTKAGTTEVSVFSFSKHWIFKDSNINDVATCHKNDWEQNGSPCDIYTSKASFASQQCSIITSTTGPFKYCHSVITPTDFYKICRDDGCKCTDCYCDVISSYAKMCTDKGISVGDWRSQRPSCSKQMQCAAPRIRKQCYKNTKGVLKCPQTCRDISSNSTSSCVKRGCIEGCYCPDGYYENSKQECVPQKSCPCYHNNIVYSYGAVRKEKCNNCTCIGGVFQCTKVNCIEHCKRQGLEYNDCGMTCNNFKDDPRTCSPGCYCKDGLALHENGTCVNPAIGCQCKEGDNYYDRGVISPSDCSRKCRGDREWKKLSGVDAKPQYDCAAFGQLHYRSFDGRMFKFDGQMCEYVLMTDCHHDPTNKMCNMEKANINIKVKNVYCVNSYEQYICKQVTIEVKQPDGSMAKVVLKQKEAHLTYGSTTKVFKTGNYPQPRTDAGGGFEIFKMGVYLFVRAYHLGYTVKFDQSSRVYIIPPKSSFTKGYLAGLCGDYNGKDDDDFKKPDLSMADNALKFAKSWGDQTGACAEPTNTDTCATNAFRKPWATKGCNVMKSGNFTACHKAISPDSYIVACQQETCLCKFGGDCACFCSAVGAYVQECNRIGIPVYWRRDGLCQLDCCDPCNHTYGYYPDNVVPETCGKTKPVCTSDERCCKGPVVEGCGCPSGTYDNGKKCMNITDTDIIPCTSTVRTTTVISSSLLPTTSAYTITTTSIPTTSVSIPISSSLLVSSKSSVVTSSSTPLSSVKTTSVVKSVSTSTYIAPPPTTSIVKSVSTSTYIAPPPTTSIVKSVSTSTYIAPPPTTSIVKSVSTSTYIAPPPTTSIVKSVSTSTYIAPPPTTSIVKSVSTSTYIAPPPTTSIVKSVSTSTYTAPPKSSSYSPPLTSIIPSVSLYTLKPTTSTPPLPSSTYTFVISQSSLILSTLKPSLSSTPVPTPTSSVAVCPACYHKGKFFKPNETWSEECKNFTCVEVANPCFPNKKAPQIIVTEPICPVCPKGFTTVKNVDKCCPDCIPPKTNECSVKNFGSSTLSKGNCTSTEPFLQTGCAGICESSTRATMGENAFQPSCTCCKPTKVKVHTPILKCPAGEEDIQVKFTEILECACSKFTCQSVNDLTNVKMVSDSGVVEKTKRSAPEPSIADELSELDEIDRLAGISRKRRAINLHDLGSLAADVIKNKRANKYKK